MMEKKMRKPTLANVLGEEATEALAESNLRQQLNRLDELQSKSSPWAQHEFVTATFANANTDVDIKHSLRLLDPEAVYWLVVAIDKDATIYKDSSASRRAWDNGVIRLRASTSATTATLLLLVKRT